MPFVGPKESRQSTGFDARCSRPVEAISRALSGHLCDWCLSAILNVRVVVIGVRNGPRWLAASKGTSRSEVSCCGYKGEGYTALLLNLEPADWWGYGGHMSWLAACLLQGELLRCGCHQQQQRQEQQQQSQHVLTCDTLPMTRRPHICQCSDRLTLGRCQKVEEFGPKQVERKCPFIKGQTSKTSACRRFRCH